MNILNTQESIQPPPGFQILKRKSTVTHHSKSKRDKEEEGKKEIYRFWSCDGQGKHPIPSSSLLAILVYPLFSLFRSKAPLQLTLSVCLSVVLSVCTPLAVLYMAIVYIVYNDSLLFLGNETKRPSTRIFNPFLNRPRVPGLFFP